MSTTGERFERAVEIMARLRAPGGCPWDREQSFDTIKPYTLEETYEVFDAIEREDWQDLKEELGDLLLQVLFYSEMAAEPGARCFRRMGDDAVAPAAVEIDDDVREEYWREIRKKPECASRETT